MKRYFAGMALALVLSSCGQPAPDEVVETLAVEESIYDAAIANTSRTDSDRARDASRRPAEILEFFGIEPGMTVLDLFSGGGYYTEIIAHVVSESGRVVAHSNDAYLGFVGEEFAARHADNRLPNVDVLMAENNELELAAEQFDAIMMVLTYHDLYHESVENGWPKLDVDKLLAELGKGLKPGGLLCIVDHFAAVGAPSETGDTVHRIDRNIVVEQLEAAGFVLDGESDLLRNPDDDYEISVFDPNVRGKTDRFVLRFRKPESP
jgi:predicted methyltransferase